jgi:integrase
LVAQPSLALEGDPEGVLPLMARDGLVVRFLAYTGLRYGEMVALAVADFDMLRGRV